jgi:dihydrofolate reductase
MSSREAVARWSARRRGERIRAMGLLTFGLNLTLDGCYDHREGIADDEMHRWWTDRMDEAGAMLFGRVTYELMEDAWPQVARDATAAPTHRDWARKLEAKHKYVVSTTRRDFPWQNTHRVEGDLAQAITALKDTTPDGVLVGSAQLAGALQRLGLVDAYRFVVHPVVAGHGPYLLAGLHPSMHLELVEMTRFASGAVALHYRRR